MSVTLPELDDETRERWEIAHDIRAQVRAVESAHPDWEPRRVAAYVLRKMSAAERQRYLLLLVGDDVRSIRRARVAEIERQAQREAERRAEQERWEAERAEREAERERERAERSARYESEPWTAPRRSRVFREWARTPEGQEAELRRAECRERTVEMEAAEEAGIAEFGIGGYFSLKLKKLRDRYAAEVRAEARLELTNELLAAPFALGDGREVTWGAATVEDHTQRIELLYRNAGGNIATAKRHEAAVRMIIEASARSLAEVAAATDTAA